MPALGTRLDEGRAARSFGGIKMTRRPFIVSFVAELIMAWVLAGVLGHLGAAR